MAPSTHRSRRAKQQQEATEPLITFQLRQHWFALPLSMVQRVITLKALAAHQADAQWDNDFTWISPGKCIFKETTAPPTPPTDHAAPAPQGQTQCLVILQATQGQQLVLPLDSQPKMWRVPTSQLQPVPPSELEESTLDGIVAVLEGPERPVFLLDPEQLALCH